MENNVYLLTKENFFLNETELITALFHQKRFTLHLRKPDADFEEYEHFLQQLPEEFHSNIIIHHHWDLIKKYKLKGLHFATRERANAGLYEKYYTSTSCHSIAELMTLDGRFSQLFISPVFNSISKKNYHANIHQQEMMQYLNNHPKSKIIALGGIKHSNIARIFEMGFTGAALLGAIWQNAEILSTDKFIENFHQLIKCIQTAPTA